MASDLRITMVIESDHLFDERIWHVFPSHESHVSSLDCACCPTMISRQVTASSNIDVYWHRWAKERQAYDAGI